MQSSKSNKPRKLLRANREKLTFELKLFSLPLNVSYFTYQLRTGHKVHQAFLWTHPATTVVHEEEDDDDVSPTNTDPVSVMTSYLLYSLFTALAVLPLLLYKRNRYFFTDLCYAVKLLKVGQRMRKYTQHKQLHSILDCFLDHVRKQPNKTFIVFEDRSYTYSEVDRESNRVARALQTHAGLQQGDTVALFCGNEAHFVWTWLGLFKLGCVVSLLNTNIRSKSLLHCFSCCGAKVLVVAEGKSLFLFFLKTNVKL